MAGKMLAIGECMVELMQAEGGLLRKGYAGDTFNGGFLAWWTATGLTRSDLDSIDALVGGVEAGVAAAAVACTRRGADPPWRHELAPGWG